MKKLFVIIPACARILEFDVIYFHLRAHCHKDGPHNRQRHHFVVSSTICSKASTVAGTNLLVARSGAEFAVDNFGEPILRRFPPNKGAVTGAEVPAESFSRKI